MIARSYGYCVFSFFKNDFVTLIFLGVVACVTV